MRKPRERDTQRSKVYEWERAEFATKLPAPANTPMTLAQCAKLVARVYKLYDKPCPRVSDGRRRRSASGTQHEVKLPRWARKGWVVLHEAAHGLARIYCPGKAAHGAEFVAIFAELLNAIYGISLYALETSALRHKVAMDGASYRPEIVNRKAV